MKEMIHTRAILLDLLDEIINMKIDEASIDDRYILDYGSVCDAIRYKIKMCERYIKPEEAYEVEE